MKNFTFLNQLSAFIQRLVLILVVLFSVGVGSMWGADTYKLTKVTSVSAGEMYVFEQDGYVMNNSVSSSALQCTNSYKTTGLAGTETYVWTLETATNGFYMKNVSKSSSQYLNNSSSTGVSFGNKSSIWKFTFSNGVAVIQNTSNSNRFLGYTNSTSHAYKAYATSNMSGDTYPHNITVYKLEVESSTPTPVDPTATFSNGEYTVGGAALDLSTLWESDSDGTVTYSVKTDGGTGASISGTSFTATTAGSCTVQASQAAATGYNAITKTATITVNPAQGGGSGSGDNYTITFATGTNTAATTSSVQLSTMISDGDKNVKSFVVDGTDKYVYHKGAGASNATGSGLRLGKNGGKGKITFNLSDEIAAQNLSSISVTTAAWDASTTVSLVVNGSATTTANAGNTIAYTPSTTTKLSSITLSATARAFIKTITITTSSSPEPIQLLAPTGLSATTTHNSATLSWDAVANASRYVVTVVDGGSFNKEYTANTNSLTITDLSPSTDYLWTVTAIGDGTNYTDSEESETGEFTTTAAPVTTCTITYDANGGKGTVPTDTKSPYNNGATVTVLGNYGELTKDGHAFTCWNTAADGSGTTYNAGETFNITSNTTLYAQWCEAYWKLVTDDSEIENDTRVIIAAKDYNVALSTTQNTNNRGQATITKKYNTVTFDANVQTLSLVKMSDTHFALYTGSGYLIAASNDYNYLRTGVNDGGNGNWDITINQGVATIRAQKYSHNQLKYNSTNSLFSCYATDNDQKNVVIYKEVCKQVSYSVSENLTYATAVNTNAKTVLATAQSLTLNYTSNIGYLLPETITVKMGGATLVSGTDYTWDKENGQLTIHVTGFFGDIDVTIAAEEDPCYGFAISTVTATPNTNTITLTWVAVDGATGYKVSINGGDFKSTSNLTYTFTDLEANTSYNWEVQAIKGDCQASKTGSTTTQKESYTITWSAAGTETTTTVTQGEAVTLPETPTSCSDEYTTFVGWFTAAAGIETNPSNALPGIQVTAETVPTGNTTYYAVWADGSGNTTTVDELTRSTTGVSGTTYTSWSGKTVTSSAVYAGQSAGGNDAIQLRSNNSNSGIITTTSGGKATKIVVTWNSNTTNGRTLNIYGKNTAYSAPTDLYNNSNQGTPLGTIVCGTSTELTISDDYEYIGLRSKDGAMYLDEIDITWSAGTAATGYISSCCQSQAVVTVAPQATELALNIEGTASTIVHISQEGAGNGKYNQPTISPAEGASLNWTGNYKQAPYDLTFTATKAGSYTITADFTETEAACPKYGTATINVVANPILVVSTPTITSECGVAGTPAAVTINSRYLTGANLSAQVATTAGNGTFEICKTQDGTFATNLTEIAAGQADKTTATIYVRYVAGVDDNTAATGTLTITDGTTSQTVTLSTTPTCGTSIRMTATDANSLCVTTAKGQWTRTQTAIHLRGAYLLQGLESGQGAKVVLSSSNSNFKFVKPDVQSDGTATFESEKITTETWEQDIHLVYTPTTYNANETTTITAKVITFGGSTVHATSTIDAYGRSFPETFVLALNTGDGWVALPADMIAPFGTACNTGVGTHDPYPITVDNNENPTTATSAPTRAIYKGAARNTPNTNPWTIQLESNELAGYFLRGSNNTNTTIYNSDVKESESVKWAFSTSDNITYQLSQTTVTDSRKLGYNKTDKVMGQYLSNALYDFRILPVENTCTYHIEPVMEFIGFAANDNPQVKIQYDGTTTYLISTDNKSTWSEITGVQDCKNLIFNLDHNTYGGKSIWLKPAGELCSEIVSSTSLAVPAPVIIEWYANTQLVHRQVAEAGTDITMPEDEIEPCEGKVFVGWTTTANLQDAADAPNDLFEELNTTLSEDAKYYAVFATEVAGGGTQEVKATLSFADKAQRTSFSTTQQVWEQNGITLTNDKANSTSDVADYANPARFYKDSKITIEAPGKISQIVFTCSGNDYASNLKTSIGNSATTSGTTVTVTLAGTSNTFTATLTSGQVRLNSLTVTYTAEGGPAYTNYSTTCGKYTITYYGFTGGYSTTCNDNPAVVEIPIGSTFTIAECTPNFDPKDLGRDFAGTWNTATDGTGTEYQPGASFTPTSDITLYAQWTLDMTEDLTIPAGIEDLASTDITVTGGKTLTLQSGTTTINSLNLRGGLENGKYAMPNVFIPTGATLVRNIETIYLDLVVNAENYYPVAVPFATPIIKDNIDYLDPVLRNASTYKTHYVFKTYDGAARAQNGEDRNNNWVVVDENATLQSGVGYIIKALTYPGKDTATIRIPMVVSNDWFANGEQTQVGETSRNAIPVTAHSGDASQAANGNRHAGWNFVASPYLSKFAGNNIDSEGELNYINGAIHIDGQFGEGGEDVPYVTVPAYDFSYYTSHKLSEVVLNPEWSFFVQIGTSGTMDFTTEGRQQAPEALRAAAAYGNTRMEANIAILQGEQKADHTGLIIDDRYTEAYEIGADLEKMFGSAYNTTIYTISNATRLAYNALPYSQATKAIPLGFRAAQEGEYTIQLTSQDYIAGVERIMLKDQLTGISTDLMYFDYTFSSEKTQDDQRFVLYIVQRENTATDISNIIDETEKSSNRKVLYNNQLYIIQNGTIYNGMGQMVK